MATAQQKISVEIVQDSDAENPRKWDNLATMVCAHRRYDLGDESGTREALDLIYENLTDEQLDQIDFDASHVPDIEKALQLTGKAIILPLYLYDHSGITMKTTQFACRWDSGQVGFIFVSKAKVRSEMSWKRLTAERIERVHAMLVGEVTVYDQYLTGDVWGFRVTEDDEETDSCWGFYGSDPLSNGILDHLSSQAKQLVESGNFQRVC
ncbi:hypothetical protein [Pseudomonas sp. 2FE]|uniref:hypothetical protein n=1 Tax=Pseudomonas sp. 2FE TaxID=2502190 RepID=UPI0010F7939E|nr:hypothetical protein [Pseudomonas sp. 2FE]